MNPPIYFFGHKITESNKGFLSNFYEAPFIDSDGVQYFCMEQYIMKKKQELFDPENNGLSQLIMTSTVQPKIKRYGREIKNFSNEIWVEARVQIAYDGIMMKFSQNPRIARELLKTRDSMIYEAAPRDRNWGIGFGPQDALHIDPSRYGDNLLGKTLMRVRDDLKRNNDNSHH